MFHHDDIAGHHVRRRKARKLVVGKIPGLDAEKHANGAAFNYCFAGARVQGFSWRGNVGVLSIIVDDVGA